MTDGAFLNAIGEINKRRKDLFAAPINRTEKYRALCDNNSNCTWKKERQLLETLAKLDEHLHYNNYTLLLQVNRAEYAQFLQEAHRFLDKATELVQAIDWEEKL